MKERVSTKLKSIRTNFKKAVDTGKRSEEDEDERSSVQSNSLLSKYDETGIGSPSNGEEIREAQSLKEQTTNSRKKVEEGLKNRRDKKLSSKLSMDTQLLNIS